MRSRAMQKYCEKSDLLGKTQKDLFSHRNLRGVRNLSDNLKNQVLAFFFSAMIHGFFLFFFFFASEFEIDREIAAEGGSAYLISLEKFVEMQKEPDRSEVKPVLEEKSQVEDFLSQEPGSESVENTLMATQEISHQIESQPSVIVQTEVIATAAIEESVEKEIVATEVEKIEIQIVSKPEIDASSQAFSQPLEADPVLSEKPLEPPLVLETSRNEIPKAQMIGYFASDSQIEVHAESVKNPLFVAISQSGVQSGNGLGMSQGQGIATIGANRGRISLGEKPSAYEIYRQKLRNYIGFFKKYPKRAKKMGQEGSSLVRFVLFKDGKLDKVELLKSSGYQSLDHAAKEAVESIHPFEPFPSEISESFLEFEIPIRFELR